MSDAPPDLVKFHVDLPNHWWHKGESLWAKSLGNNLYRIENVPFCAYGLNYGDVVLATPDAQELKPEVRSVVERSGHQTLRLSFCDKLTNDQQRVIIAALESMGGELERANAQFVCIDIPPHAGYASICDFLVEQETLGLLDYETCEQRVSGSFDDKQHS
jgi:hypothetical protein